MTCVQDFGLLPDFVFSVHFFPVILSFRTEPEKNEDREMTGRNRHFR